MVLLTALSLVSAGAFLYYGLDTVFGRPPRGEYERYGMPRLRVFVGTMQILGAIGVLIGLEIRVVGAAAAAGLTLMMLMGLFVRVRLHDAPRLMVPAGTLSVVNAALVVLFVAV